MKTPLSILLLLAAGALAAAVPAPESHCPHEAQQKPGAAGPNLDTVKRLLGDWVALDEAGEPTDEVVSTYRETAGGSAVLETLFAGTDHEMLTVYHMDGEQLVLTHFCVMGNQPRMRALPQTRPDELVFEFVDGANIRSDADAAMRNGSVRWIEEDRISTKWVATKDGKVMHDASFELRRRK